MLRRFILSSVSADHHQLPSSRSALFHSTTTWLSGKVDYYEILGVQPDASAATVKKHFYSLSKTHHPDHNRNDPQASSRFVQISEAYAVLGNAQKRERYDRDNQRVSAASSAGIRRGSHASSTTPFGSRPPSGLSRRRTQFRGPPPSFYRSGGWGSQGEKRQAQAEAAGSASADAAAGSANAGVHMGGGLGPGGAQTAWSNDVPHFDRQGHFRTQEQQELRRKRRMEEQTAYDYTGSGSMLINFILVGTAVSLACFIPTLFEKSEKKRAHEGKGDV
ncbi:MAG: hypothetical protein FRX48_06133 [Lasallia pustulata]|uniref:J domain-containing protein n=1 Tax=Lasallia pustulata TaxID=136370 RepID=A0A5M8PP53_9LECA|nr:MAG: hypothetical protein FRX48_06133 [Lasallia pustulata]